MLVDVGFWPRQDLGQVRPVRLERLQREDREREKLASGLIGSYLEAEVRDLEDPAAVHEAVGGLEVAVESNLGIV